MSTVVVSLLLMVLLILLGMEIGWAIGATVLVWIAIEQFYGTPLPFVLIPQQIQAGIQSFVLLAIPLFLFAGELMSRAGVTNRLVNAAAAMVGHWTGGLGGVAVTANFIMSGISGSALADAAATGSVLLPEMKKHGYPPTLSCAIVAAAATVGPIIPPSIMFILLAALTNLSVGELFLSGVVPGILMFVAMLTVTAYLARRRRFPSHPKAVLRERMRIIGTGVLPLFAPVVVIGVMVLGIATPTEAAAVAVLYTLFLGFMIYRTLTVQAVFDAAVETATISAVIMITVAFSQVLTWLTVYSHFGQAVTGLLLSITTDPLLILLLFNVLFLLLGMLMEPLPIMYVFVPVMFPLLIGMGYDPIQLGLIVVLNLMIGMITPPLGLNLFVVSAIANVRVEAVSREVVPYIFVLIAVLLVICLVPEFSLALPTLLMRQ